MKKIMIGALAIVMCFMLVGCGIAVSDGEKTGDENIELSHFDDGTEEERSGDDYSSGDFYIDSGDESYDESEIVYD